MKYILIIASLFVSMAATAADNLFDDPAKEAQARTIFEQLRCVVCDGQSLAGSNAKIAIEMRNMIRDKITQGESDETIITFFRSRYGDDVLMTPPISAHTYVLWFAPFILLAVAFLIGIRAIRG